MNYTRWVPPYLEGMVPPAIPTQPPVRHMIPVRAYLVPELSHLPLESRAIFMNPTIPPPPFWSPAPLGVMQYGFTAATPFNPTECSQSYSTYDNRPPTLEESRSSGTQLLSESSDNMCLTPRENVSESSRTQENQIKSSKKQSSSKSRQTRHDKKPKSILRSEKNSSIERNQSKTEKFVHKNYRHYYDLSPEILNEWRRSLKKSKESFSVPKVKIEICLKNEINVKQETTEQNLTKEKQKTPRLQCSFELKQTQNEQDWKKKSIKQKESPDKMSSCGDANVDEPTPRGNVKKSPKKSKLSASADNSSLKLSPSQMSSSSDTNVEYSTSQEDGKNTSEILPKKSKFSVSGDYSSLKFTPSQVDRKHKHDSISRKLHHKRSIRRPASNSRNSIECDMSSVTTLETPCSKFESDSDSNESTSFYATPENTPSIDVQKKQSASFIRCLSDESRSDGEMPDSKRHSSVKRSLSDEYKEDSETPNSSLSFADYYTPESSPRTPVKRLKTRWSDSTSSFSSDISPFLNWRKSIQGSSDSNGIQPELIGYQMVGDSQFCRFGQQLLGLEREPMPNSPGKIGICVSGQTITDLHKRVRENFYPIADKIILMIGTNDFLRNVCVDVMCRELSALVHTLQKSASKIILLTLPPIPKLEKRWSSNHFVNLEAYNRHIRSLEDGDNLRIADISPLYINLHPYKHCKMSLFEMYFNGPAKRFDLIHLNRSGLDIIRKYSLLFIRNRISVVLLFENEEQLDKEIKKEVRDYAIKIGINPDTEKHLLNIALDGLMSPLPEDWKACLDERINRIYYYNVKTHQTQWVHPLDQHFENLVKKKRQEESISAGDDDSKTSNKEDLKSFEEAVTTSDMMSSRNPTTTHKSRLSSPSQVTKDVSPEGRKLLNPIGRPPLPPKRKMSPKRGLNLRLSPGPSPTRIDIDSIGVPVPTGLPSPDVKSDKQQSTRSSGIKLTGGGSAFLKTRQKQSPSPSEETNKTPDEPLLKSFEIVREAESIDCLDDEKHSDDRQLDDRKLKHSASLGESGFDKLVKSKKFTSLQESLSSLKSELELSSEPKSPSATGLRGILRDKPSPSHKLWDIDPALLTSAEKEKLRAQELKEERKQNVRFADIVNKPINIEFLKSESEDESTTNDSSNDLDDLILENMHSDEDIKKGNRNSENFNQSDRKVIDSENSRSRKSPEHLGKESSSPDKYETNKNILSRLTDLNMDSGKNIAGDKEETTLEIENNNKDDSETWLTNAEDIMNQNEKKIQALRKNVYDITKIKWDSENNPIDKHVTEVGFAKLQSRTPFLKSPTSLSKMQNTDVKSKDSTETYSAVENKAEQENANNLNLKKMVGEVNNDNFQGGARKSKLMPEVDLRKVFQSVKESILNSSDLSDNSDEGEPMETSPSAPKLDDIQSALEQNEEDLHRINTGAVYKSEDKVWEKYERHKDKKFEEYKERQKKNFEEKKTLLHLEYDESIQELRKELQRQESIERQRIHLEVQESMARYKEELESEKNKKEAIIRNECEDYLKDLEISLSKEKEEKIKKMKEEHEAFLKEQELKIDKEKEHFEEEKKIRMHTSSSMLEKIVAELKQKEEEEISRIEEENTKKLAEFREKFEQELAEHEKRHKQELESVEAEYKRVLTERRQAIEQLMVEQEAEIVAKRAQHQHTLDQITEQHRTTISQLQEQNRQEEESLRRKHAEKMEALNAQLNLSSNKEDITQINREFEKVRCEKRLLEDKYKSLKEKYVRLKNEVRLSMERKRQAKLNRQLQQQQRDPASTTEDTTDRSTDHGKPPFARKKLVPTLSSDEGTGENLNGTPKTIKRRPKPSAPSLTTSTTAESTSNAPPAKPKNVWDPSLHQRREGVSSAEDNHTSVSEEIQLEQEDCGPEKWTHSALSPLENLRKQLEKLDDLEEQFPTSVHTDTYLRYPFSGPAGGSCELDFYRHRLHLERESVRRAKQALAEQRLNIEAKQLQLRHKQHSQTLNQLHKEERELTDMEVNLHRTRALLGEKIIRLRYLEQSIERAAAFTPHHPHSQDSTTATNTDSSGFSGSDLDLSNAGLGSGIRTDAFWTENVLQSLENINSEIREIWTILGKQQVPGLGPPPMLNYENRAIAGADSYTLAPHRATDIADRTRRLKEWLVRTREQQTHMIAPVTL